MLPSSGYFRGIACPGQLKGACNRPYCHFRHDMKVSSEKNTSPSPSSSQVAARGTPVVEEAFAVDEEKLEEMDHQIMAKEVCEWSSASVTPIDTTPPKAEEQQSQPHTSQQQEPAVPPGEVPKSEILQQLMSEALKKVLAENPTLASTVDASSIRIGIDPVTQESSEVNKTKKQLYHRPPDTPSYNPTPIRELKKRKQSVDGVHNLAYNPTCSRTAGDKGSGDEGEVMGEFSSDESEEVEEKNDDFDLLEEVLAEHSKNNKVKVKKKKVKELGKLQYSLSNAHKSTVDNNVMIADAKKLSDKEVKKYELPQTESVNKIITDGPYFLPPSPIFTSSSDGFEAFNARAALQEEEASVPEECVDAAPPHTEPAKTNSPPPAEKKTPPKQPTEPPKSSSQPETVEKVAKASGHAHLPQLLSARGAPKLSRPNVRPWTPLVRNNIPSSEAQKTGDQLDEILQLMDGSEPSSKRKLKESEQQTSNQKDSESVRPKKKYKVDLNKEIESLSNPALEHSKESAAPEEPATQVEPSDNQDIDIDIDRRSTKEGSVSDERNTTEKPSPRESEEKEQTNDSEATSGKSEDSEEDTLSDEYSDHKRSRHRKKRKRKRSRSSSSGSDYSHYRRKKRKRSRKHHQKRSKRSRRRRNSASSLSDQSQESEEEREEKKNNEDDDDDDEEEEENDGTEEEEENEDEEKENKSKEDSESEDEEDDSNDDIEHTKKSKRHRKKHKYYKKLKHKRSKHKARRRRRRSKSYSRSRSTGKSRDSSRSRSGTRSRSSSKHRKKRNRSRHKSRNYSDSDSSKENSRSRSSSRSSSKHQRRRESREDDSSGSRHRESSKSRDKRTEEENKSRKEDRRKERSNSKPDQASDDKRNKNHNDEEVSIPMPVDPSKIKIEKNALVPDLSKVKIEKEDPATEKSNSQVSVSVKESAKSKESSSSKGQGESGQGKVAEKIPEQRRPSGEDKNRRRKSHERKDSTESTSDKAPHRRQSCDSKASDNEGSLQRKKTEERRSSTEKIKRSQSISSQPSEMSMFDLVLASAETSKPAKTLTEISMFDSVAKASTNHSLEASGAKNKSKDASHKGSGEKGSGESAVTSEHKSSSSDKSSKSSRLDKTAHTDSHHRHTKTDSKPSHSTSKSKGSSSSSSTHHSSSSSSNYHSSSSHKRTSSTSSRSSTSKHHSTPITTTTTTTTTTASTTTTTPSSSSSTTKTPDGSSSSKSRKLSDTTNSRSDKESSRHSSRRHSSSSSNKHHDSSRKSSSSSSRHKDSKDTTSEAAKNNVGGEASKKRRVSADDDSQGGGSDVPSSGVDSPLPDLSVLDEISQDDWEQMISGKDGANLELNEDTDSDDVDTDNPFVLEECMKMFNEFQPGENHLENQVLPKKIKAAGEDKEPPKSSSKQRVARSSTGNLVAKKSIKSRHHKTSPMQMMVERYQKLKEQLKMKEEQLHHLQGGPSSVTSSSSSKTTVVPSSSSSSSTSSSSHHIQSQSSGKSKKRIAHVPNVNSLLSAHEKIKKQGHPSVSIRISPKVAKASGVIPETTAHTVAKGGKRIAHTPKIGALAKPIIQPELGSLVPQNIRQRYLNALIEECKKFTSEKESFNIAAAEERVCYKRAPSRMVYLNLVVNAVKRLRTQQQAGDEAQELLEKDPQLAEKMCIEEASPSTVKPSPPASSPSSKRPHPINPNHVHLSHTTVLSSGGIRGSWSIEKPKKSSASQEDIKGDAFYKNLTKYIMTEEQLEENGYPCPDPEEKGKAIVKKIDSRKKISPSALERFCDRCSVLYTVDKWGFPKNSAPCVYHWGRAYKKRKYGNFETSYSCCGGEQGSGGCSQATTHVSDNYNPKNLRGYVRTISKDSSTSNKEVYALDCEMCYTTEGNELTRITVINSNGDVVYEQLVKPENPILDYNTRFSGITENDMEDVKITIRDVQAALLARFSDKTILIGHSLESDLHALKIIHTTVVDTSVVFPHKMGPPYKRALKNLAAEYLKRIIQDDVSGHDSAEDAIACLHLMQWKVKDDLKGFSK